MFFAMLAFSLVLGYAGTMETTANSKTLITEKMARAIAYAFIPVVSDAREAHDTARKQDREMLAQFGATPDAMEAAGFASESTRYTRTHKKLMVLMVFAKGIKDRTKAGDTYLEDEIEYVYSQIQHNHTSWNANPDFDALYAGAAEGWDSVLNILQKELSSAK